MKRKFIMGTVLTMVVFWAVGDVGYAGGYRYYLYYGYYDHYGYYRFIGEAPYQSGGWGLNLHSEQKPTARLTASKLIGAMLRDSKGKDLGQIDDLVVDHMGGRVISFIVSGKGGRPVTVRFGALSESGEGFFTLKSS